MTSENPNRRGPIAAEYLSPGPLAYMQKTALGTKDHTLTKVQAPAYSIGSRPLPKSQALPGPTYYYDPSITVRGRQSAPAYSLSSRHPTQGLEVTPGPGAYNSNSLTQGTLSNEHRSKFITMGHRTKWPFHNDAPPPNSYLVKTGIGSGAKTEKFTPSWSMAGRTNYGGSHYNANKSQNPGPGAYGAIEPNVIKKASGSFTLSGRTRMKDYSSLKDNPGPGAYNVKEPKCSGKGCTMGIRHSIYTMPLLCDIDVA